MPKYIKSYSDDVERCGAVHPKHPDLRCTRFGKCPLDDHMGIWTHSSNEWIGSDYSIGHLQEIVVWGDDVIMSRYRKILK